jgi:peptidoglycan/xylan/chitin deacetylase (PgdA/CDA1 family)
MTHDGAALVLCYHHVHDEPGDALGLSVHPEHFAEHLHYLRDRVDVVPLANIDERETRDRVSITFDDGLADTAEAAAPLLEAYGFPATVFVPTAALEPAHEFWWERLVHLVLEVDEPAQHALDLEIAGRPLLVDVRTGQGRWRAFRALNARFLRALPEAIDATLAEVADQLGGVVPSSCERHRKLTREQLRHLAVDTMMDVGGHTRTHALLAALDPVRQSEEIAGGRRELEVVVGQPVESFAYPYGYAGSFTAKTARIVREAGYARACTTITGTVGARVDRFRMPRHQVQDGGFEQFRAQLEYWLAQ